jgi:hypothetical protein
VVGSMGFPIDRSPSWWLLRQAMGRSPAPRFCYPGAPSSSPIGDKVSSVVENWTGL